MFAELIENYKDVIFKQGMFSEHKQKVFRALQQCRTGALGGHIYYCENCGTTHLLNNSCRNRNCPVCQGEKRVKWVNKQCNNLLNIPYYHVVFTIPKVLNQLFLKYPNECYKILYHAAWETLKGFFSNKAKFDGLGGMICLMHTWGQNLSLHPHLHCIVPGAGIDTEGNFKILLTKGKYLFNVKSLSSVFQAKFVEKLTILEKNKVLIIGYHCRMKLFEKQWVVNIQKPFGKPEIVVEYIGRYTHSIAISERRIISFDDKSVTFSYKNYKQNSEIQQMQLPAKEFLRRFGMHILPYRFVKIRHYGVLSNSCKKNFIELGEKEVGKFQFEKSQAPVYEEDNDHEINHKAYYKKCPKCNMFKMRKLCNISAAEIIIGIVLVDINTAEIVFQSRAGPIENYMIIKNISLNN